ncbi:MAG: hypothetical protein M3068_11750 [Gemmatimonadota bacterium]|nr:hypothetical protein [Gemmatimonadota bacterium]
MTIGWTPVSLATLLIVGAGVMVTVALSRLAQRGIARALRGVTDLGAVGMAAARSPATSTEDPRDA